MTNTRPPRAISVLFTTGHDAEPAAADHLASTIDVTNGVLTLMQGDALVATYAAGRWVSAQAVENDTTKAIENRVAVEVEEARAEVLAALLAKWSGDKEFVLELRELFEAEGWA